MKTQAKLQARSPRDRLRQRLQEIWGYPDFRPPQGEIAQCLLQQRDALVIMPTGGGKSICFQLPALLQTGLTLVVSPLVALMEDQVRELQQRGLPAASLHSQRSRRERQKTLQALERQTLRLLYLSPETLLSPPVWDRLCHPQLQLNGLILDEAHCLAQWGDTFRPTYYRLGAVRPALLAHKPLATRFMLAAFTATADPHTQQTIQTILQLRDPAEFRLNPYRANLRLNVQTVWTPRGRRQQLRQFMQAHARQSGLVYVRTRRDGEELAAWLQQAGFSAVAYHAGLGPDERRHIEQDWLTGKIRAVVCTNAFGMGINKPDCRWVVHFHLPLLLAEYVQEVGRAGRDGKPAIALALVSEPTGWLDNTDRQRWQFFAQQGRSRQQAARQLQPKLPQQGDLREISQQFKDADLALAWLHRTGQLAWDDPFHYRLTPNPQTAALTAQTPDPRYTMPRYAHTRQCRWQFLLVAFGFAKAAIDFRCGHCDNCRR